MFLCTPFPNFCLIYSDWAFEITFHSGFTLCRFTSLGFGIHLITALSIRKRLSLYEYTLWGRDLVSVVRIRETKYYRVHRGFYEKIYENFVRTLETVHIREVSVPRDSTAFEKKKKDV